VATFIACRVLPLQRRSHKICQISVNRDPTWMTTFELTKTDIRKKVQVISKTYMPEDWEWGMAAYHRARHAPQVTSGIAYSDIENTGILLYRHIHYSTCLPSRHSLFNRRICTLQKFIRQHVEDAWIVFPPGSH
jgi:hypothetical protein